MALTARLEQAGHEVFTVQVGLSFAKIEERAYTVNPHNAADFDTLLDALRGLGKLPQTIVHLWNLTSVPHATLDVAMDASFYSLLFLAQSLGKRNLTEEIRMLALSNGLHDVSGNELIVPEKAALLGPIQIIPLEYPQIRCRAIDIVLPESGVTPRLVETLFAEISVTNAESVVAWREQHRWVQAFEPLRLEESKTAAPPLRQKGVYLITGGLGGIGLTLAKQLAQTVSARLVLVGKSELPPREVWDTWQGDNATARKIAGVREIEQAGGQVLIAAADVTETEQLQSVVAMAQSQFGPLNGVIHAAGIPGGGVIQLKTREAVENVMAAKVCGTLALAAALKDQTLDFIALCSSINAIVGRLGQVEYVAANAFMDAFVHAHPELPFISINWETWRDTGMAAAAMQQWLSQGGAINHPLFSKRQPISADAEMFISHLRAATCWEMNEHWILNKPTLPGTAYIEMACAAYEAHTGQSVMDFHNIVFLKPLVLEGGEEKEVRLLFKKQGLGFAFSVISQIAADEWDEHANGSIFPLEKNAPLVEHDLAEIGSRCNEQDVPAPLEQSHLGHFRLESGSLLAGPSILITDETDSQPRSMEFGRRWITLRSVKLGADEGLGFFELSEDFSADLDVYKLHPALLDFAASFLRLFKSEGSYLPLSYKRLKMHAPLPRIFYSYARFVGGRDPDSPTLRFDLVLLDENGRELVTVEEFSVVKINDASKLSTTRHSTTPDQFFNDPSTGSGQMLRAQREASLQISGLNKDLAEGLSSAEGAQVFERILASGLTRVVVSTRDLAVRIAFNGAQSTTLASNAARQAEFSPASPAPPVNDALRRSAQRDRAKTSRNLAVGARH